MGLIAAAQAAIAPTGLPLGPAVTLVLAKIIPEKKQQQRLMSFVGSPATCDSMTIDC